MVACEEPERREMTEVSSACLEGVDSIMLCHETSMGKFPIQAMNQLAKSIAEAENIYDYDQAYVNVKKQVGQPGVQTIDILAQNGAQIAYEQRENVDMFVCMTETGKIARHLAKQRPKQPILACSTSGQVVR
jgi:pyruvate kinase